MHICPNRLGGLRGEMKRRHIIRNNNAVSGVVEALLIVALIAIILATIQLVYIPPIMEDKETEHMDEVEKQLSYLKSTIDIQSMTKEKVLISSPVTLGSKELPYFVTMGATGQINLFDMDITGDSQIKILPGPTLPDFPAEYVNKINLTSIKYQAFNSYIDDYTYVLEGGGIIAQKPGEEMMVKPSIIVENDTNDIKIYYNIPVFTGIPGKKIDVSGYGDPDKTVFIRTNYSLHNTDSLDDITYIQIHTYYPDAWNQSLISSTGLLWEYYQNGYINVTRDDTQSPAVITIEPIPIVEGGKNLDIELTVVKIGVQIGPGIVES
jgi:hypothetical protein